MAAKRRDEEVEVSDVPTPESVTNEADVLELRKIEDILKAADVSGGTIRINRKGEKDTKWMNLDKMKVEDFNIDEVRSMYGGGDYQCQTFRANGSFYKRFEFSIDYRLKGKVDINTLPAMMATDEGKINRVVTEMQRMSETAQKESQSTMGMMMTMMQNSQNTQMQMMQQSHQQTMAMVTQMMAGVTAAMGKTPPPPPAAPDIMPVLIELIKNKPTGGMSEAIAALRDLRDLAEGKEPAEPDKPKDTFDRVVDMVGPVLSMFASKAQGQAVAQPPQRQQVQPAQAPARIVTTAAPMPIVGNGNGHPVHGAQPSPSLTPAAQQEAEMSPIPPHPALDDPKVAHAYEVFNGMKARLKMVMPFLVSAAKNDSDPASYFDMLVDSSSLEELELLYHTLKEPNWVEVLFDNDSRVSTHLTWFESLRSTILTQLKESYEPEQPEHTRPADQTLQPNQPTG